MFYFDQRKNLRITATGSGTISFTVTIAYGGIDALRSMDKPGFD